MIVLVATGQQLLEVAKSAMAQQTDLVSETWVLTSTVGPADAAEAGRLLGEAGARVLDAPVTGGVPGADSGQLRFLAAGGTDVIDALRPVLSTLGEVISVGERIGDGQAMKITNQLCSSAHLVVAAEAVAFARSLGLDPARAVEVISGGSGASWFLDDRGPRMARGAETADTRLAILAKDSELVAGEADRTGAFVPMLRAARERYELAGQLGLLEEDDSQIVRTYTEPQATEPASSERL